MLSVYAITFTPFPVPARLNDTDPAVYKNDLVCSSSGSLASSPLKITLLGWHRACFVFFTCSKILNGCTWLQWRRRGTAKCMAVLVTADDIQSLGCAHYGREVHRAFWGMQEFHHVECILTMGLREVAPSSPGSRTCYGMGWRVCSSGRPHGRDAKDRRGNRSLDLCAVPMREAGRGGGCTTPAYMCSLRIFAGHERIALLLYLAMPLSI